MQLSKLLREHRAVLRADFLRLYSMDLDDVPVTELNGFIAAMPRGTLSLSIAEPRFAWTDGEYLLADILDSLNAFICGFAGRDGDYSPCSRPGDRQRGERAKSKAASVRDRIYRTEWKEVVG